MSCLYASGRFAVRRQCAHRASFLQASMWVFVLSCLILSGCGGAPVAKSASLKGTVKFNGDPLPKGAVRLSTEDGTPGPGGVSPIEDGHYEITDESGLKAGKYLVIISAFKKSGRKIIVDEAGTEREEEKQYLPRRYNDSSELHLELTAGENTKDFELTN